MSRFHNDEVTLQLVRAKTPVDGAVHAALLVDLAPGWKTYWIDPGASGIPPTIDLSKTDGVETSRIRFPAPHRYGANETAANGYKGKAALAIALTPKSGTMIDAIDASIFMGVCKEICIPVSAKLTVPASAADDSAVAAAFAALPKPAPAGSFAVSAEAGGKALRIAVKAPAAKADGAARDAAPDLFVTATDGWFFDKPTKSAANGDTVVFNVPIVEDPGTGAKIPSKVDLVFTKGKTALEATAIPVAPES
ncbi:hypothetical protein LQ948_05475 [Jiella sp. MQZ9-1]|uniref:Thiol:disulfide interchange protein DsbD N-terminal domain-containing protein n=1 Tax=Jiella flava TaxID=2816857 RepID=A0A939JVJ1_9HYPH|nr:protein-disulfide reductase DsbD domain-containing protein [Jiella flava]MBO0662017.1 hypothetical protein [Jiella flava]MCD2470656.1 hypothetical protein [Jiella flava]